MEEEVVREQPKVEGEVQDSLNSLEAPETSGSLGKFKDAESLLAAYNN